MTMKIPKDPFILLSFVNTKLRDEYSSLDDLCRSMDMNRKQLEAVLSSIHYSYRKDLNRFVRE